MCTNDIHIVTPQALAPCISYVYPYTQVKGKETTLSGLINTQNLLFNWGVYIRLLGDFFFLTAGNLRPLIKVDEFELK